MKALSTAAEWIRPIGISVIYFMARYLGGDDPVAVFHLLGAPIVMLMSGSVAAESLLLGSVASAKIGYAPNRAYQVQSALNNLATALTALLVFVLGWGRHAEATVVIAMLLFFVCSATNHTITAVRDGNMKPVNLLRPVMALLLVGVLLPPMWSALSR